MNQYIITEEKLAEIESTPNEDTKDWLRIFYGLCDGVRSHHYQSERDTVLELLRLKYVEFLNHPCPELADKYKHCCDADWCGLCTLDEVLAELRQAGEQCGDNCKGECSGEVTGTPFCPQSETEQKTPDHPLNYATMAILARIGKQAEFKEAWERLENAERNYICGDIYNIVKSACSHPYQSERDKVLDELEKRITEEEPVFLFTILGYIKELRRAGEP